MHRIQGTRVNDTKDTRGGEEVLEVGTGRDKEVTGGREARGICGLQGLTSALAYVVFHVLT